MRIVCVYADGLTAGIIAAVSEYETRSVEKRTMLTLTVVLACFFWTILSSFGTYIQDKMLYTRMTLLHSATIVLNVLSYG